MRIVVIAWLYVALMMSLAEATNPQGSVLGALITFVFYGVAPLSLVMYLLGTPARRRAQRRAAAGLGTPAPSAPPASAQTDAGGLAAGHAVASEREEP